MGLILIVGAGALVAGFVSGLAVLGFALGVYALEGVVTAQVVELTLICLPATLLGVWLGLKSYGQIDERQFRAIVLWLLFASGLTLTVSNLL